MLTNKMEEMSEKETRNMIVIGVFLIGGALLIWMEGVQRGVITVGLLALLLLGYLTCTYFLNLLLIKRVILSKWEIYLALLGLGALSFVFGSKSVETIKLILGGSLMMSVVIFLVTTVAELFERKQDKRG